MNQAQMSQAQTAGSASSVPGRGPDGGLRRALLCRASSRLVALPITSVIETMRPQPVQALPGLPGYVRGVAMIRGVGVPVVDLARLLGSADSPDGGRPAADSAADSVGGSAAGSAARFVTLRAGRTVALAVDAVLEVRSLDDAASGHLPPLLGGLAQGLIASLGSLDPDLLLVLEASQLVDAELWRAIDAVQGATP